jgi:amidase
MAGLPALDRDQTLEAQMRRFNILRDWAVFFDSYPVLLMPNSWQRQFPIDADKGTPEQVHRLLAAQAPLLGTAMMGLPGLAVPTGVVNGLPVGVQLSTWRFREDLALRAGELIERAAGYDVLAHLAPAAS